MAVDMYRPIFRSSSSFNRPKFASSSDMMTMSIEMFFSLMISRSPFYTGFYELCASARSDLAPAEGVLGCDVS